MKYYLNLSLITVFTFYATVLHSAEPVKITNTNHPLATAYNNGRKIARTSDDSLFVIYQDLIDNVPAVMLTFSKSGDDWSQPIFLDEGLFPSLTIDEYDNIYAVWMGHDSTHLKISSIHSSPEINVFEVKSDDISYYLYPSIEVSKEAIHVVWQGRSLGNQNDNIFYVRLNKSLSDTLSPIIQLSADSCASTRPTITGGLFPIFPEPAGLVHILWTDISQTNSSKVMYCNFDETKPYSDSRFSNPEILPDSFDHSNPSVSSYNVHFVDNSIASFAILAHSDEEHGGITVTCTFADTFGIRDVLFNLSLLTGPHPMPCLDDVLVCSCALLWHDNGEIYYAQLINNEFVTLPPIPVGQFNQRMKQFQNVGYKTFREKFFDVVWTEGNEAPYDLMFRRMDKRNTPLAVNKNVNKSEIPQTFQLLSPYPSPFNNSTAIPLIVNHPLKMEINILNIAGVIIRKLVSEKLAAGQYFFTWDGRDNSDDIVASGLYFVTAAGDNHILSNKMVFIK